MKHSYALFQQLPGLIKCVNYSLQSAPPYISYILLHSVCRLRMSVEFTSSNETTMQVTSSQWPPSITTPNNVQLNSPIFEEVYKDNAMKSSLHLLITFLPSCLIKQRIVIGQDSHFLPPHKTRTHHSCDTAPLTL